MTRAQILEGLSILLDQLATGPEAGTPEGWYPHDWAYVKGIASGEIMRLRDRLASIPGSREGA